MMKITILLLLATLVAATLSATSDTKLPDRITPYPAGLEEAASAYYDALCTGDIEAVLDTAPSLGEKKWLPGSEMLRVKPGEWRFVMWSSLMSQEQMGMIKQTPPQKGFLVVEIHPVTSDTAQYYLDLWFKENGQWHCMNSGLFSAAMNMDIDMDLVHRLAVSEDEALEAHAGWEAKRAVDSKRYRADMDESLIKLLQQRKRKEIEQVGRTYDEAIDKIEER